MRTLYLECSMGAAGDMLASALLELVNDADLMLEKLNSICLPNVEFIREDNTKCGIKGTHLKVLVNKKEEHEHNHEHHHHHSSISEIEGVINSLNVSNKVKNDATSVYKIIAEAESKVHAVPVADIHFHEVGAYDAIADVVSVCMLLEELNVDKIMASEVNTGSGQVKCVHGILPVPAPATALILTGIPTYSNEIKSELCTPTGAALLKYFSKEFGNKPKMNVEKIGYGMGNKDFDVANCVRAFLGEQTNEKSTIIELDFNVDDMTGEDIAYLTELLLENGAREAFTIPVVMKKSRNGNLICVLCDESNKEKMLSIIFKNSTTIGVREEIKNRYTLERRFETINTPYGDIRKKISSGYGVEKSKYEYDDLARIAKESSLSLNEVREIAKEFEK